MDDGKHRRTIFRRNFLDKGLVTFVECVAHYRSFGSDALMDEMRLLLTGPMLAIPFNVSSARYYALLWALVRCAGTDNTLSEAQRAKLVRVCIDIGTFLRSRVPESRAEAYGIALASAFEAIRASHGRPYIVDEIGTGLHVEATPDAALSAAAGFDDLRALDFAEPPPALRFRLPV